MNANFGRQTLLSQPAFECLVVLTDFLLELGNVGPSGSLVGSEARAVVGEQHVERHEDDSDVKERRRDEGLVASFAEHSPKSPHTWEGLSNSIAEHGIAP